MLKLLIQESTNTYRCRTEYTVYVTLIPVQRCYKLGDTRPKLHTDSMYSDR